jgi:serine/threonine protein phosphatase PrpC
MVEDNKKLFVANAGDSRAVLGRAGKAVPLSFDHKPENEEEKDRIHKAGSTIQEGRVDGNLNLSRSLGDLKYK